MSINVRQLNIVKKILDKSIFNENIIEIILLKYWDSLPKEYILLDWINESKLNYKQLSSNPNYIQLLRKNIQKIDWYNLSKNNKAINILLQNINKINWDAF